MDEEAAFDNADAARVSPDGRVMLRIDDHWHLADEMAGDEMAGDEMAGDE